MTGNDSATGMLFTMGALLSILTQVHITAYAKAHWRPLQAITLGLTCMAAAFVPMLVAGPFLPLDAAPIATSAVETAHVFLIKALNLSPAVLSAALLALGTMTLQPFVLSLIPSPGWQSTARHLFRLLLYGAGHWGHRGQSGHWRGI